MLQRAASNAYSWWWASHVRTKQSKWLEQSLQDMEEKVTQVLKLIEEDGDSFAKRAEMYYRKRPEIIHFVQETYGAYRGLAERYDLMSKELQKANSTLASAFPDQYQYAMDDDDHDPSPGLPAKHMKNLKIPDVPKRFPAKKIRAVMALTSKNTDKDKASAGISKDQALEEIDKLQKAILTKQTEKEFTKSSYERGVARYWEIEQEITDMQENVSKLQYEFGIGKEIEDDEARTLMLEAAMKSCQDTLIQLQEKHVNSAAEAREEGQKIKDARNRLLGEENREELGFEDGVGGSAQAEEEEKKPKTVSSGLSVSELADKIDELVNKVINLENAVSSQTAITQRLRGETDELLQSLDEQQQNKLVTETEEVKQHASDFLKDDQQQNKLEAETEEVKQHASDFLKDDQQQNKLETETEEVKQHAPDFLKDDQQQNKLEAETEEVKQQASDFLKDDQSQESTAAEKVQDSGSVVLSSNECETIEKSEKQEEKEEEEPNWQQLFVSGLEGKEKVLLNEYTSILRNYKQVKKKLGELENSKTTELRELQVENSSKDEEIQRLRQTLILLQKKRVAPESKNNAKDTLEDTSEPYQGGELEDDTVINLMMVKEERTVSPIEDKLRADIDVLLEENLDFWMRFSASFSQVQKFQNEIEDLHKELAKIEKNKKDSSSSGTAESLGDARPIYKHLKEIQTELTLWLEKSSELKDELVCRFSQLCQIQEDITLALSDGAVDDEMKFTSFQAAKFQGEVLNMQQENKKVEDELQACVEHVTNLQTEVERSITKLNEELGISGSKSQMGQMGNRNRIPLRAFIFGVKPKKQKQSILSNAHPTWHKKYHSLKPGQS